MMLRQDARKKDSFSVFPSLLDEVGKIEFASNRLVDGNGSALAVGLALLEEGGCLLGTFSLIVFRQGQANFEVLFKKLFSGHATIIAKKAKEAENNLQLLLWLLPKQLDSLWPLN